MYLLLHADKFDSECGTVIGCCVIELTKEKVKSWLDKISLAKKIAKQEEDFRGLEYFELASWIGRHVDFGEGCIDDIVLNENEEAQVNENTTVPTEVDRVHVFDTRILFSAYLDETTILLESDSIGCRTLKRMYIALSCRPKRLPLLLDDKNSIVKGIVKARLKGTI